MKFNFHILTQLNYNYDNIMNTVEKSDNNKFPSGNLVYLVKKNHLPY